MNSQLRGPISGACTEVLLIEATRIFTEATDGPPADAVLEVMGFGIGRQIAERAAFDIPRLTETLDVIKFVCKEFWKLLFDKSVDNLKTNHKGVYVLHDKDFRWLRRLSLVQTMPGAAAETQLSEEALRYLHFPCGLIRGALHHLGICASVNAQVPQPPICAFTLHIHQDTSGP